MTDSQLLLAEYARSGSDAAFRDLVACYVDLVYSTAIRLVEGDTHRAEDVAQTVFVDLARQARTFSADVMLGGWLHRHTCFVAANTLRGERRRQSRERQAVEMNALQNDSGADFEPVAPILDDAINQLGEADRTAILLRFFEQRDLRSVGEALGNNEDAARMRVNRALEKLHSLLKRRGFTTTAASLSIALSANAVQTAPVGLAVTISTAAAVAGTAVSTSTAIAATKAIAMTTLQKTLVTATGAVLAGAGIYEARQAAQLREQNQTLRQQQAPLIEQNQHLQNNRADATTRLADLLAENSRLKSGSDQNELLRLRDEVSLLRRQLVELASNPGSPSNGLAALMQDPAMKEYMRQNTVRALASIYSELIGRLKLTPEQRDQFIKIVSEGTMRIAGAFSSQNQAGFEQARTDIKLDMESQLQLLLGETGLAQFKEFDHEIPARVITALLNDELGGNPITDAQRARLLQIVKAEPYNLTHGIVGEVDPAFLGTEADVTDYLQKVAESNRHILQQAGEVLNQDQLAALNTVLTNGINARKIFGNALVQKR